jgi:hypothetical protein
LPDPSATVPLTRQAVIRPSAGTLANAEPLEVNTAGETIKLQTAGPAKHDSKPVAPLIACRPTVTVTAEADAGMASKTASTSRPNIRPTPPGERLPCITASSSRPRRLGLTSLA